ncbi:putative bifunctional diguanylate cyclase/phosphodiesterase [Pararhizobium sp.]|uniref:putative bifunctional diguanylate cyclase/phosphodiesterase n=1 Tax=Pararhizobium sp. TaxID=1977563 RepID=UPI00272298A1|nr:EAL domain-containing protein [Pararhizobium sp.]MDO9419004.1 EAL domain-containing protein [Pararhizobium sp.]
MTQGIRSEPDNRAIARQIRVAQALSVMEGIVLTLLSNCFIALTTVAVLWMYEPGTDLFVWLAGVLAVNIVRLTVAFRLKKLALSETQPEFTLLILSVGAFASGCLWGVAPFLTSGLGLDGANAYVIFIIVGLSAGALMQNTAYSRTAVLFGGPPLVATLILLIEKWSMLSGVIALDVVLLAVMMVRSSQMCEAAFIRSQEDRLGAVSLAGSLSDANRKISLSNTQLETLANLDALTGLGNRALFNTHLKALVEEQETSPRAVALLIVDLDRFKTINDTMGHGAGDTVLVEIGRRLSAIAGPNDIIVRLGGDEFAVIVDGDEVEERAERIGAGILASAQDPILVYGRPTIVGSSVGLAFFPAHGRTAEELFASADIALYAAKEAGRRRLSVFTPCLKAQIDRHRLLETSLPGAIDGGEIRVFFQPQVALVDGNVIGFEALLRWTHPTLGVISPPEVVMAAHTMHLSEKLTLHIACAAAALIERLPGLGLGEVSVAINVSPREFSSYSLSDMLATVRDRYGIDPARLEVEITEEATLDATIAGEELAKLEQAGYRLAVDDFGMGHSSLAYLVSLRIDRLKIDRSFVTGIAGSRQNQALIAALIGIGHALEIDIVVEGVETAEEAEILRILGCRVVQGYHYGRPMPVEDLPAWLAARPQHTPKLAAIV